MRNIFFLVKDGSFFDQVTLKGVMIWFLGHCFAGFLYWAALYHTSLYELNAWDQTLINYGYKLLLTIPVYWLIFFRFKNLALGKRILLHLVTGPLYIIGWLFLYYATGDVMNISHLTGNSSFWDYYIGSLIYLVQFFIFHIYENHQNLLLQKEKEAALLQSVYRSEINALKSQIQPHFLFNTLNSISASVPAQQEHTRILIARLADTFRYSLKVNEKEQVSLKEELVFITNCLDLEKERFADRLTYEILCPQELMTYDIPPMILQPIVENAVRHGISKKIEGGKIEVNIHKTGTHLHFVISDTGVGIGNMDTDNLFIKGIGLKNVNLRLQRMFEQNITIQPNFPTGTIIRFSIPVLI